ncbi:MULTISPECIES: HD domain-containing protein [unclassified Crossiella]|uniref:HD domain-containing protein n=1 Tax=unclassified Crossiella TaxID=2620835 RepID=UPI001FFE8058|nr:MULTISPECIES: HD domain-containing protein [unclassified Crossiella]MCK2239722.1 HD domain-containing protein [Crossiella sp. S99.2]MCK2252417.1 HD domain-containing protein [Crossiella sp. S99.1]
MTSRAVALDTVTEWEKTNAADLVEVARETAAQLLTSLERRWQHVRGVAARATEIGGAVHRDADSDAHNQAAERLLVASAWLHDVGYSPSLVTSRLHAVDGAEYLARRGFPLKLVNLVAHHSGARFEAVERGLGNLMEPYPFEDDEFSDALTAADLTTSPDGQHISYDDRIDEILTRYAPGDPVHEYWLKARPVIGEAIARVPFRIVVDNSPSPPPI